MRKPIEEKPPLAAWATLSREGAGMSVEETVAALAERGHAVTAATIRGIEGGSKGASARLQKLLAIVYGVTPPGQKETGPPQGEAGMSDLIAALTAAVRSQTEVLLDAITARDEAIERLLRELAEYRTAAIRQQVVEQSLIEALPVALATALAATREDDPVDAPLATVPQ